VDSDDRNNRLSINLLRINLLSRVSELQKNADFLEDEGHDAIGRELADEYNKIRSLALA